MPSPFPGMDPYLEDPGLWPDVHHNIISVTQELLGATLRPNYSVRIEERVYISDESDPGRSLMIPDVMIVDRPRGAAALPSATEGSNVEAAGSFLATTMIEEEIREARIVIIDRFTRQVVTVIEVLSPTNKLPGAHGEANYQEKRLEVMRSPAHLVEIDLLRDGWAIKTSENIPLGDYRVHVLRAEERPQGHSYRIDLPMRLPKIAIPLKPGDADAQLDLQAVLNTVYERAAYDLDVDYRRPAKPPLPAKYEEWARSLVAARPAT